ncbi:bestrophin family protein [Merismopedia glauca]|nr:bestrophin family ion channel [Merismopedia glauca]
MNQNQKRMELAKLERVSWFHIAFQLRGSVIPAIVNRVILCGSFGCLISILFYFKFPVSWNSLENVVPSVVLGLLLVFRTNTAYERFWEGRKCWGTLVNSIRNLSRLIWVAIAERHPQDRSEKIVALKLLVAFAVATKLHLRGQKIDPELEELLPIGYGDYLRNANNSPLEVAYWIGDYLQVKYEDRGLQIYQLNSLNNLLNNMVDVLGGCERILKTPIPLAYAIHLKQLLLIYCLLLPLQLVAELSWFTGPVVALISFTLFGVEEIALEIENPFGLDANDLPLDAICDTLKNNIRDLVATSPNQINSSRLSDKPFYN